MNRSRKRVAIPLFTIGLILLLSIAIFWPRPLPNSDDDDNDITFEWVNRDPSIAPPAVFSAEMIYDSESDRIVLFSGAISPYVVHNGTWAYDYNTNTWENITPATSPGGRGVAAMAYDSESDRAILFAGIRKYTPETVYCWGDTWAFNYNTRTWENMTPEVSPRARCIHNMAYDSESDRVILYGGFWGDISASGGRRALNGTWAYDYNSNTWTKMNPVTTPGLLYAFGMAYDSESDRVILYGGKLKLNGYSTIKSETWAYDLNTDTWTNMDPPTNARQRDRFQMTYHAGWDRVILFGGDDGGDVIYDDSWAYDYNANNWTELEPVNHPSERYYSDLAYDEESDRVILFGGDLLDNPFNETWALDSAILIPAPMPIVIPDYRPTLFVIAGGIAVFIIMVVKRPS